jgi:hypothetical protein
MPVLPPSLPIAVPVPVFDESLLGSIFATAGEEGLFEAGAEEGAAAKRHVEEEGEGEGEEEKGEGEEEGQGGEFFNLRDEKEVLDMFKDGDIENW